MACQQVRRSWPQDIHHTCPRVNTCRKPRPHRADTAGPEDDGAFTGHDVDPATASFLGEIWDTYGGCFADVKLVIPAARRHLPGTAHDGSQVPVGGAA
jgi:hypothetical protein